MHIVVVDPSRVVHRVIAGILEAGGHDVLAFDDAAAALEYITECAEVDVLVTSLETTPIAGIELVWRVRTLRKPIYVIVMSSQTGAQSLVEALDSGADEFIEKPPRAEALTARLRAAERLLAAHRQLIELAERDSLTGLYNRRAFFARFDEELMFSAPDRGLTVIMLDIDIFKQINDAHGHDMGDEVIRAVARTAAGAGGIAGRLGGEEFAIVLSGQSLDAAIELADDLREQCANLRLFAGDTLFGFTCSFGVSIYARGDSTTDVLKRADQALYVAKRNGRNRVESENVVRDVAGPVASTSGLRHLEHAGS